MRLSSLYTNKPDVFPDIDFLEGLNVVFARVKSQAKRRDSHNLGKTFLISVLDYALVKKIDKHHPFKKHKAFESFVFFLEIVTNSGKFVTIRRSVSDPVIQIQVEEESMDLRKWPIEKWSHSNLRYARAKSVIDRLLALTDLSPYDYRKGLGFSLRKQSDYDEVFQLSAFRLSKDRDWKPFVAQILGLGRQLGLDKYEIEDEVTSTKALQRRLEKDAGTSSQEYDEVRGLLDLKSSEVARTRARLDGFSFSELEAQVNEDLIQRVESEVSELNEERYTIDFELSEISKSLKTELNFVAKDLRRLFSEAGLVLKEGVLRSYEELEQFNRDLTSGRRDRLRKLRRELARRREEVEHRLGELDLQRQSALYTLKEAKSLKKFRDLQRRVLKDEQEVLTLQHRLKVLNRAALLEDEIGRLEGLRESALTKLRAAVRAKHELYSDIRRRFSQYVAAVLDTQALIAVSLNKSGNLEFVVKTVRKGRDARETEEGRGTSYRKLLSALFDLALASARSSGGYYRFVYHDGIFEGLDNRKKGALLKLIQEVSSRDGIQYVLTVIDTDLPRDEEDQKLFFGKSVVIRELHDQGNRGRLFRMPAF